MREHRGGMPCKHATNRFADEPIAGDRRAAFSLSW